MLGSASANATPPEMREAFGGALLERERFDASSSDVRARIESGESADAMPDALPVSLGEYIRRKGFYGRG